MLRPGMKKGYFLDGTAVACCVGCSTMVYSVLSNMLSNMISPLKPYGSPCTLNKSPLNQHMVWKFSSAAAQGFAGQDGTESVMQRKQAFSPEPCRALLQPLDILYARV
ncbi:TPA: hypothetical protein ACH3X3_012862 [Trebouxia sp. C0006]